MLSTNSTGSTRRRRMSEMMLSSRSSSKKDLKKETKRGNSDTSLFSRLTSSMTTLSSKNLLANVQHSSKKEIKKIDTDGLNRSDVNNLMSKEVRVRNGCKNMLKAISKDPKNETRRADLKTQLSCIQANITTLQTHLQSLNKDTVSELYAEVDASRFVDQPFPVITIARKETIDVDVGEKIHEFITNHYHEDASYFKAECTTLAASRILMKNAACSEEGKEFCLKYFWQLSQSEHRAFQEDKCGNLTFTWHDAFQGHPVAKRSLKLEKASVLFNIAAIDTQLATLADRNTAEGLRTAAKSFQQAAGVFQTIREESAIKNSVGTDLARSSLSSLSNLMLAQAQESLWFLILLNGKEEGKSFEAPGAEAAAVSEWYQSVRESLRDPFLTSIPDEWLSMIYIKEEYYGAIADWFVGVTEMKSSDKKQKINGLAKVYRAKRTLEQVLERCACELPTETELHSSIQKYLKLTKDVLQHISDAIIHGLASKLDQVASVTGKALQWAVASVDHLGNKEDTDLFGRLGPIYFFNSMCALVDRATYEVVYDDDGGYGFTISGGNPCRIADVSYGGPGNKAGLIAGVYIIKVDGVDARCMQNSALKDLLAQHSKTHDSIAIEVVVNYDMQNFEELINPESLQCLPSVSKAATRIPCQWSGKSMVFGDASLSLTGRQHNNIDV